MIAELTELEEMAGFYSDYHKDTYGFRPRHTRDENWTVEDYRKAIDDLTPIFEANQRREREEQQEAIAQLDADVAKLIAMGAKDRATALRWIVDDEHDLDYVCYERGLPYGHLNEIATPDNSRWLAYLANGPTGV